MTSSRTDQRIDNPFSVDASGGAVVAEVSNVGMTASSVLLRLTKHASQTGIALDIVANDGTKHWFVDASHNTVTYGAQTAPTSSDTNGFFYIPKVVNAAANTPGGTPANLTSNYANSVPCRVVHNQTGPAYSFAAYVNGGWRAVTLT